jgi:glutathione S-transferase
MQPTVFIPSATPASFPRRDHARLAEMEYAVGTALSTAAGRRDFTDPALRFAVTRLGAAAREDRLTADELLARLDALVRAALPSALAATLADAVLVYLWRFARHAIECAARPAAALG